VGVVLEWLSTALEWLLFAGWRARLTLALCLVGLLATIYWVSNRSTVAASTLGPLPAALEDRAPLLAAAWISRDTAAMRRLVAPESGRELQHWLAKSPRPGALATSNPDDWLFKTVSVVRQPDPKWAIVTVRVARRTPADSTSARPADFAQQQFWNQRNGVWCFCPRDVPAQPSAPTALGNRPASTPARRRR